MSTALDQIVPVSIKVGSIIPSQISFGVPMIVGQFLTSKTTTPFTRSRIYASLADMKADGWTTSDVPYLYAASLLSQNPNVQYFVIGRRDSADADWATALDAIQAENSNWYAFTIIPVGSTGSAILTEQLQIAAWAEIAKRPAFMDTADATILAAGTSDAASQISALKRNYSVLTYHAATSPVESASAGWLGYVLPLPMGSYNPSYRQLSGITPDALTVGQKTMAWSKFCNTFSKVAGKNFTERGFVAGGEYLYFDVTFGIDWLDTNIQTAILGALASDAKVPFTDGGGVLLKSIVEGVLQTAANMGILDATSIVVTVPKVVNISDADKAARKFPNVNFKARLQGAVNTVVINGTVSF